MYITPDINIVENCDTCNYKPSGEFTPCTNMYMDGREISRCANYALNPQLARKAFRDFFYNNNKNIELDKLIYTDES